MSVCIKTPLEFGPDGFVVSFPVAAVEGGLVNDGALPGAAGEGVVGDGAGDVATFHVFDGLPFGAGKTHPGEPFACRENDTAVLVIPGVGLILAKDRELGLVDCLEFLQGEPQCHACEYVDFHKRLAPFIVGAQGTVPGPLGREIGEFGIAQARVVFGPRLLVEKINIA